MKLYKNIAEAYKVKNEVEALKISIKGESFPPELLDFVNLKELYLEGNCSNFPYTSPTWNKLKVLSLKWPAFTGDLSSVFSLPELENLKIIETPIKTFLLPLGYSVAPIKSLTIKDSGLKFLPEEISILSRVQEMNLSGNELTSLPKSFITLNQLKRLNLDSNKFSEFPDGIKKISSLHHLSIDNNLFSPEEKARIQREFHLWTN